MLKFSEKGGGVDLKQNYLLELYSLREEVSFILDFHYFPHCLLVLNKHLCPDSFTFTYILNRPFEIYRSNLFLEEQVMTRVNV